MKSIKKASAVIASALLAAAATRADVKEISVAVKGATCPICTHSINMSLRTIVGVKSVKMSLATRVNVAITPQAGTWIDPARIFRQISVVGFQPKTDELMLHVIGILTINGGQLTLTLPDIAQGPIRLTIAPADQSNKRDEEVKAALINLSNSLIENQAGSRQVEVEGWWRPPTNRAQTATLLVTKITLAAPLPAR